MNTITPINQTRYLYQNNYTNDKLQTNSPANYRSPSFKGSQTWKELFKIISDFFKKEKPHQPEIESYYMQAKNINPDLAWSLRNQNYQDPLILRIVQENEKDINSAIKMRQELYTDRKYAISLEEVDYLISILKNNFKKFQKYKQYVLDDSEYVQNDSKYRHFYIDNMISLLKASDKNETFLEYLIQKFKNIENVLKYFKYEQEADIFTKIFNHDKLLTQKLDLDSLIKQYKSNPNSVEEILKIYNNPDEYPFIKEYCDHTYNHMIPLIEMHAKNPENIIETIKRYRSTNPTLIKLYKDLPPQARTYLGDCPKVQYSLNSIDIYPNYTCEIELGYVKKVLEIEHIINSILDKVKDPVIKSKLRVKIIDKTSNLAANAPRIIADGRMPTEPEQIDDLILLSHLYEQYPNQQITDKMVRLFKIMQTDKGRHLRGLYISNPNINEQII